MTASSKLEDVALIVCSYGKDNRFTSQEAAVKIIRELGDGWFAPESPMEIFQVNKVQEIIRKYRNGTKLEETTRKVLDIVNELKSDFDGVYFKQEYSLETNTPKKLSATQMNLKVQVLFLILDEAMQQMSQHLIWKQ
jgi:hypothetical protein